MVNEFSLFRKNRNKVSYSNSFVFRSRCKYCSTLPQGKAIRKPMLYSWISSKEFRDAETIKYSAEASIDAKISIKHISQVKDTSIVPAMSMNVSHFKNESSKFSREEYWPRMISCSCGLTWWLFKNTIDKHTARVFEFKKK